MMGHTHALVGATLSLGVALVTGQPTETALGMTALGAIAAIAPDIDHPAAPIRRKIGAAGILLFWLKHRGITHTLIALVVVGVVAYKLLPLVAALAVILGYASHLVTDMMTRSGLEVLWPLVKVPLHITPKPLWITTGKTAEHLISIGVSGLFFALIYAYYPGLMDELEKMLRQLR